MKLDKELTTQQLYDQQYYKNNKEKRNTQCSMWHNKNKDSVKTRQTLNKSRIRDKYLRRTYGISSEDYATFLETQQGQCGICGASSPGDGYKYFDVDHDHATNIVRGLLCRKCNKAIGLLNEDAETIQAALLWIKR